jgi:hypothetical protein
MDVITLTTLHLQARYRCGGESAKHFTSDSKPSAAGCRCRTEDLGVTCIYRNRYASLATLLVPLIVCGSFSQLGLDLRMIRNHTLPMIARRRFARRLADGAIALSEQSEVLLRAYFGNISHLNNEVSRTVTLRDMGPYMYSVKWPRFPRVPVDTVLLEKRLHRSWLFTSKVDAGQAIHSSV